MDKTVERLIDFTLSVRFEDLSAETVEACKIRLLDTLGCVAGAYADPVAVAARALAAQYSMRRSATVLGSGTKTAPEVAAFANGVMLRLLDLTDMYRVKSGGHPSDIIAAVLAGAELGASDGKSLLAAIALGYEVYCSFCDGIDINSRGWDQPTYGIVAAFVGVGKLMGLTREQLRNGLSLAIVPNLALFQTRRGELSSWKGCAAANACRNAVWAGMLAEAGFAGPEAPIEGESGLRNVFGDFDWPIAVGSSPQRICHTHLKSFPICYHGQSAVWAALALHPQVRPAEVELIRIATYRVAIDIMASDKSRWAPDTRETADHSLPYVVSAALIDGKVDQDSFGATRMRDSQLAALLQRTEVIEDAAFSRGYPKSATTRVSVRLKNGSDLVSEIAYPLGHAENPMSFSAVEQKFRGLFRAYGESHRANRVVATVANLEELPSVQPVFESFSKVD